LSTLCACPLYLILSYAVIPGTEGLLVGAYVAVGGHIPLEPYPKNRTGGIPMPLIPTHRDASVTFSG